MQTIVFLDLDDTIMQTRPKCPGGGRLQPAAHRPDGTALSFMTERQVALLAILKSSATVIPATARNLDAFRRVRLAFPSLAVLDFGGVILRADETADPCWDAIVRPQAKEVGPELHDALKMVRNFSACRGLGVNARLITDFEMPLYLVLKHPHGNADALETVRREHWNSIDQERFFVHCNGNNLTLVPRFLGKERAVRHILDYHVDSASVLTVGMGDSLSDAPFLAMCDYALLPRGCQLSWHMQSVSGKDDV